jgi:superfamily II DNA/RNA helicase
MPAKSRKADGTPKVRWSAADRAARGHGPRRRGGQARPHPAVNPETGRRPERPVAGQTKPKARTPEQRPPIKPFRVRPERRAPAERWERPDRAEQRDRPERAGRVDRGERPERRDRPETASRFERPERRDRPQRPEGRERFQRTDRPETANRFERTDRRDRPQGRDGRERPERFERPERRERFERPERPQRPESRERFERPERRERPERFESRERFERPERRDRFEQGERPDRDRPADHETAAPSAPVAPATPLDSTGDFAALGLPATLVASLAEAGLTSPFPIQAATIPAALTGRDVLGRARTGSGKTLAFGLPILATLPAEDVRGRAPRALVLAPTRELAMQVHDVLVPLARPLGLSLVLVAGGMSYTPQQRAFERGVDLVVATPGRLIDLMDQGVADLGRVRHTVLDEADHMADLGFLPAMTQLLDAVPADGQRLLFSATLDGAVDALVRRYLSDPVTASVDAATASVTTMTHLVVPVAPADKARVTAALVAGTGRSVVFVRTQLGADRVAEQLRAAGVMAGALHGGLAQGARTRILAAFRDGSLPTLVATDVAARGLHVDDVGLVLQVDPPHASKEYLHRAGRTARAGGTGQVVTLALPHQRREVRRLLDRAGVRGVDTLESDDARLSAAGDPPAGPISEAEFLRLVAPPTARRRPTGPRSRPYDKRGERRGR